tara:strand:+ start:9773 stop:10216 length:444 start_codon:yes stop_codon:yes gene_type:complete
MRPAKISTDERGRSVWSGEIEEAELELVSTMMLKTLLSSKDAERKQQLEAAAASKNGVLAKNLSSGAFEIIDDDDLMAALASADDGAEKLSASEMAGEHLLELADTEDEELSLVSTQALRKILGHPEEEAEAEKADKSGGFDPYNSG